MYVTPGTHSTPANGAAKPPADPAGLAAQIGAALGQPAEDATSGIAEDGLGAVFFGAMTYIGNGPNFMVKSIAHDAGVHCPTFFGYILRYSLPILLPILALSGVIFL